MNDLTRAKLKEIAELQDIIKKDYLNYKSKRRRTYNFSKYSLPIVFLKDILGTDNNQSNFANELKN